MVTYLATGRVIAALGATAALLLAPCWSVACMALIACMPTQATVAAVEVSRKLLMYSVTRPAREVLFTVVPSQNKYKV